MIPGVDWSGWLARWDRQQSLYMENRERRFSAMFDVLQASGPPVRVVDLACGPGSLTQRLLRRFPAARAAAVDFDPVLLHLGRSALESDSARIDWVEADLRRPGWAAALPEGPYDAVLSTTALHWLSSEELVQLYGTLPRILRPGGVFLNGDHLPYEAAQPTFARVAREVSQARRARLSTSNPGETWDGWWSSLEKEPQLASLFAERRRRFPATHHREEEIPVGQHEALLLAAGFREAGTIWQEFDDRVVVGFL
jgi:trans-aconitate methyltransferase